MITTDGHAFAHNGTIHNHRDLAPDATTDTHALAALYDHHRATGKGPATALRASLAACDTPAWAVLVLDAAGPLLAWRNGLPLWRADHTTGIYYASRTFHPEASLMPEDTLTVEGTCIP